MDHCKSKDQAIMANFRLGIMPPRTMFDPSMIIGPKLGSRKAFNFTNQRDAMEITLTCHPWSLKKTILGTKQVSRKMGAYQKGCLG